MQLEEISARIDRAFGEPVPVSGRAPTEEDLRALERVFGDEGYQLFLQDQVSRQIIRDYLTNAVLLGYIGMDCLDRFAEPLGSREGRSALSLHMLMISVEEAAGLPGAAPATSLQPLAPGAGSTPTLSLVPK